MLRCLSSTWYLGKINTTSSTGSNVTKKGIFLPWDKSFPKDLCVIARLLTNAIINYVQVIELSFGKMCIQTQIHSSLG